LLLYVLLFEFIIPKEGVRITPMESNVVKD